MPHRKSSRNGYLNLAAHSVAVMDDHRPTLLMMRDLLRGLGFQRIYLADNMAETLRTVRTCGIDLLLADIALGSENGLALVTRIRGSLDPRISGLPIVVVSSHATPARVIHAGACGVNGFVAKPITVGALARRISEALLDGRRRPPAGEIVL